MLTFSKFCLLSCAVTVGMMFSVCAQAQVWGYVDEKGVAHLATEKLDERYSMFLQPLQNGTISTNESYPSSESPNATLPPVYDRLYQRLVARPNINELMPLIEQHANQHGLDPYLIKALIAVESSFEPTAVSPKGAIGLMQIIVPTAQRYGVTADKKRSVEQKLKDPRINIATGTKYLAELHKRFANNRTLALAAYNAGEGAVEKYGNSVPPYAETQSYVKLIDQFYALYAPPKNEVKRIRFQIPGRGNLPASGVTNVPQAGVAAAASIKVQ